MIFDLETEACPICGYVPPKQYVNHIVLLGRMGASYLRKKFGGVIIACPECLPPVVIHKVFT